MSIQHILGLPEEVEGVGAIYPIRVKEMEEFHRCSPVLHISKAHFPEDAQGLNLLDLIALGLKDISIMKRLERIFSLALRKEVKYFMRFEESVHGFSYDDGAGLIHSGNYDEVRAVIMKNNLIFEPKVFKNKFVQQWAEKVLAARAKDSKTTAEEMASIINAYNGMRYEEIGNLTIYQLHATHQRVARLIAYETTIRFRAGGTDIPVEDYSEKIDLFKSPYDDLFVSKDKLNNIDKAL